MASSQQQIADAGDDDAAALFHSYPCAAYYVESPSAASHSGNSTSEVVLCAGRQPSSSIDTGALLSPFGPTRSHASVGCGGEHELESAHRQALSRYSSSHGSNNSFLTDKKLLANAYELHDQQEKKISALMRDGEEEEDQEMGGGHARRLVVLDFRRDAHPFYWVVFQLPWRLLGSLGLALLVFFFATKPPPPQVFFNIVGVEHFSLGEGLDVTGVATKVLSCNCSVKMEVDNKSKVFGLHIHPPFIELAFGPVKFATTQSQASYVQSASSSVQRLFVGVRNKPMYGAGRSMQDLLESGRGLPLIVRVRLLSTYRIVWDLIKIKNHQHEDCIIILQGMHEYQKLYAKMHNSTCFQA